MIQNRTTSPKSTKQDFSYDKPVVKADKPDPGSHERRIRAFANTKQTKSFVGETRKHQVRMGKK